MKIGNKNIPVPLVVSYLTVCRQINSSNGNVNRVYHLDKQKEHLHNLILSYAGTDRNDSKIMFDLALLTDSFLCK